MNPILAGGVKHNPSEGLAKPEETSISFLSSSTRKMRETVAVPLRGRGGFWRCEREDRRRGWCPAASPDQKGRQWGEGGPSYSGEKKEEGNEIDQRWKRGVSRPVKLAGSAYDEKKGEEGSRRMGRLASEKKSHHRAADFLNARHPRGGKVASSKGGGRRAESPGSGVERDSIL